jgi:hypothetical protein
MPITYNGLHFNPARQCCIRPNSLLVYGTMVPLESSISKFMCGAVEVAGAVNFAVAQCTGSQSSNFEASSEQWPVGFILRAGKTKISRSSKI